MNKGSLTLLCHTLLQEKEIQKGWEETQKLKKQGIAHAESYNNYIENIYIKGLIYTTSFK